MCRITFKSIGTQSWSFCCNTESSMSQHKKQNTRISSLPLVS
ncbi:hypothetical protein F383_35482 [Gossypium arboreum]|uniref:Uncharacterized protein n=1 Tax=Gossypium arboreum TaxID=29729 RepID=A0A0B0N2E6_GOSAR|nr:hypothetical protein F383_35482 [Gossypium arboreum]